ncbi:hypothetical protein CAEBREN_15629 [Caenorhabditis brenneri]|uniref:Uncharacterized protein n=1 Tax=Caenorhabditis brenneri TaxID=135651 RepID=G0N5U5_CAEBE|nr:hypothetical protein CAEBREN_15629 [Caenorhabditis brenneri]
MKPKHLMIILFVLFMVSSAHAEFMEQIDELFEAHQWLLLVLAFFCMISLIVYIFKYCNPFGPFCAEKGTLGRNNKKHYFLDFIELDTI